MIELAVLGVIVVFAVAMLIRFALQNYFQVAAEQEAFRQALKVSRIDPCQNRVAPPPGSACDKDPDCRPPQGRGMCQDNSSQPYDMIPAVGGASVIQVRDRRTPDPSSPFGGSRSPYVASSSVNWGSEGVDYRVTNIQSMARLHILVNERQFAFLSLGYLTEDFDRIGNTDQFMDQQGTIYDESDMLKRFCEYDKLLGNGDGTSGMIRIEPIDNQVTIPLLPSSFEPPANGERIPGCAARLSSCPATGIAKVRGDCTEVDTWRLRLVDPCSADIINKDNCEMQCRQMVKANLPKPPYCDSLDRAEPQGLDFGNFVRTLSTDNTLTRRESGSGIQNEIRVGDSETITRDLYTWTGTDKQKQAVVSNMGASRHETWDTAP